MISTAEWYEGYVSDVPYTANFYYQLVPDFLNFCCLLAGFKHPDIDDSFTYIELGSGMGFGLSLIASLYPQGSFFGIDFNPQHISFSNFIKKEVSLENITFIELSFEELVKEKIDQFPSFDYIVLHGIFSWVNHENRTFLVDFIRKKLKPGGLVYISYNNMCGWCNMVPLQRFCLDYSKFFSDLPSVTQLGLALSILKKLQQVGSYYTNFPEVKSFLTEIESKSKNYLAHEYLNEHWRPMFITELFSYLKNSKLIYVGQAEPVWRFEDLILNKKQVELLQNIRSPLMREFVKDLMVGNSFRREIFVKGGLLLPKRLWEERLKKAKLILRKIPSDKKVKIKFPYLNKHLNIKEKVVEAIIEKLKDGPQNLEEVLQNLKTFSDRFRELLKIIAILVHGRMLDVKLSRDKENREKGKALNRLVARNTRYNNLLKHFVLPDSMSGIQVDIAQRLLYDAIANEKLNDLDKIFKHIINQMNSLDFLKPNKFTEEEIIKTVEEYLEEDVPVWERLGAI